MELGARKLKILQAVIEAYIQTGEPVGSKALCELLDVSVSSATIRNEMASLSELGLLEQPHTSAGRIPTQFGYRLYINELMKPKPLSDEEMRYIDGYLSEYADDPDLLLEKAIFHQSRRLVAEPAAELDLILPSDLEFEE